MGGDGKGGTGEDEEGREGEGREGEGGDSEGGDGERQGVAVQAAEGEGERRKAKEGEGRERQRIRRVNSPAVSSTFPFPSLPVPSRRPEPVTYGAPVARYECGAPGKPGADRPPHASGTVRAPSTTARTRRPRRPGRTGGPTNVPPGLPLFVPRTWCTIPAGRSWEVSGRGVPPRPAGAPRGMPGCPRRRLRIRRVSGSSPHQGWSKGRFLLQGASPTAPRLKWPEGRDTPSRSMLSNSMNHASCSTSSFRMRMASS